jgi:hypothetical protein
VNGTRPPHDDHGQGLRPPTWPRWARPLSAHSESSTSGVLNGAYARLRLVAVGHNARRGRPPFSLRRR